MTELLRGLRNIAGMKTHCCIFQSRLSNQMANNNKITAHTLLKKMNDSTTIDSSVKTPQQRFDYFLVLDFEATCDKGTKIQPQEIIEFPVLKVNSRTWNTDSIFHQYVRPIHHPRLSTFCTELTGITQGDIDEQPDFVETMQLFKKWMNNERLLDNDKSFTFVTCGDWDLKTCLKEQCQNSGLTIPDCFNSWINIKQPFSEVMGAYPKGMMMMMGALGLKHEGRHHSGIDDCKNIAKILVSLAKKGYIYKQTSIRR